MVLAHFQIRALQIMIDPPLYSEAKFLEGGGSSWYYTDMFCRKNEKNNGRDAEDQAM